MLSESAAGSSRPNAGGHAFWWRLTDNLFRRIVWFLLPVLAMTALGVSQAVDTLEVYQSTGTLSASTNPLVPEQSAGIAGSLWETPAAATSRIINERLRTNTFLTAVANEAGLGGPIEDGLLDLGILRASIWASADGDSILSIHAQWADAPTSYELVAATIDQYESFITETVASNSSEAEVFWSTQLEGLQVERDEANQALTDYVSTLPQIDPEQDYPFNVQLEIDRLSARVASVEAKLASTEANIDVARLARAQQTTEAGRSFTVIDAPRVPTAPQSTVMKRGMLVVSFMMLGVLISAAALLVTTVLDQTVASSADLLAIPSISLVATVPPVAFASGDRGRRSLSRARQRGATRRPRGG